MAEDKIVSNETQYPNPFVFVIGYALSMCGIMFNKKVRNKFSIGEPTHQQQKASDIAVIFIAVAAIIKIFIGVMLYKISPKK